MGNIVATEQQIAKSYKLVDGADKSDVYTSGAVYATQSNTTTLWHPYLAYIYQGAVVTLKGSGNMGIPATLSHDMYER